MELKEFKKYMNDKFEKLIKNLCPGQNRNYENKE